MTTCDPVGPYSFLVRGTRHCNCSVLAYLSTCGTELYNNRMSHASILRLQELGSFALYTSSDLFIFNMDPSLSP